MLSTTSKEYCVPSAFNDPGMQIDVKSNPDKKNWFYSLSVFEPSGDRKIFRTQAEAIAYDAARLTDSGTDLDDVTNGTPSSPEHAGWKIFFDNGAPNTTDTVTLGGSTYHIYRADERVTSTTGIGAGCAYWNTLQPLINPLSVNSASQCPVNAPCKAGKKQISYLYGASPATGALCLRDRTDTLVRSTKSETLVPPHMGKLVAYFSKDQVSFGLTSVRIPQGGANISLGQPQDFSMLQHWLPVGSDLHACRHSDKSGTGPPPADCR